MASIADLSDDPQYPIKIVCSETGIRAVTLRAWERRYQLLNPRRAQNQYRRYSEQEIAILRWVKNRVDSGMSISSVVDEYRSMTEKGQYPEAMPVIKMAPSKKNSNPPSYFAKELYKALICHDETLSLEILRSSRENLNVATICLEVITPCLVEIGEAWFRGEVRITTEHFSSNLLRGQVENYFQSFPTRRGAPYIITGCAPGERHEIGSLILSTLLRSEGYRVEYLGQDVYLSDLIEFVSYEKPAMVCISATMEQPAFALAGLQEKLSRIKPIPIFAYGGQAFIRNSSLRTKIPGIFLGSTAQDAVAHVKRLI